MVGEQNICRLYKTIQALACFDSWFCILSKDVIFDVFVPQSVFQAVDHDERNKVLSRSTHK